MGSFRSEAIELSIRVLGAAYRVNLAFLPTLRRLVGHFRSARSTGVSSSDFISLYRQIRHRRPRAILELGAGQSSAVIALAANGAKFVAVEENPDWLAHHREVIPADLLDKIDLIQRGTETTDQYGPSAVRYVDLPRFPYEFVHVDGPAYDGLTCDIIDLIPDLGQRCLVVFDGREKPARFARPHLEKAGFRTTRHPFTLSYQFVRD